MESPSVSRPPVHKQKQAGVSKVLVLSAKDKTCLQRKIEAISELLVNTPEMVSDLVYTLGLRREHLSHRAFALIAQDGTISDFETSRDTPTSNIIFVFTGQGAQWPGMGKELFLLSDCFRECIKALDETLKKLESPPNWTIQGNQQAIFK